MDIISAIASFSALLVAFLIYSSKKKKSKSDKIIIAWIINFAFHFAVPFFLERKLFLEESLWGMLLGVFIVGHAPFLFVYTLSLTNSNFKFNFKNLYHFGFILLYIFSFTPYLLLSDAERIELIRNKQDLSYHVLIPMMVLLFSRVYFLIRTIIILYVHQINIKQVFSFGEKVNLAWLKRLTIGFFLIILLSFIAYGLASAKIISVYWMDYSMTIANIMIFFYLAYYGYQQQSLYLSKPIAEIVVKNKTKSVTHQSAKNEETDISNEINPLLKELIEKIKTEKIYLNAELNIGDLANDIQMHAHQLSKLINTNLKKNFFEFINDFRIEEFKKLAANPKNKHISILGLAMDAGFNSKASFNRIFKKETGLTPSEFRKSFKF